jgi:phage host-nuclease inhibitor protein Gam
MNPLSHIILEIDRLLEDYPELADDEQLRLDTIEGETDAHDIAARLVRLNNHAEAMAAGVKSEIEALNQRRQRYVEQSRRARVSLQQLLQAMNARKLELPAGTVSLRATPPSLVITDSEAIPADFWRVKREPDNTAIKDALKKGQAVEGCTLSNGGETISIRVAG